MRQDSKSGNCFSRYVYAGLDSSGLTNHEANLQKKKNTTTHTDTNLDIAEGLALRSSLMVIVSSVLQGTLTALSFI